jgi:hypothetical protein
MVTPASAARRVIPRSQHAAYRVGCRPC